MKEERTIIKEEKEESKSGQF